MEFNIKMKSGRIYRGYFKDIETLHDMTRLLCDHHYIHIKNIAIKSEHVESVEMVEQNEGLTIVPGTKRKYERK